MKLPKKWWFRGVAVAFLGLALVLSTTLIASPSMAVIPSPGTLSIDVSQRDDPGPSWIVTCGAAFGRPLTGKRYNALSGSLESYKVEAPAQTLVRDSYTLTNLFVRVTANTATANTTVTSRINGGNGNLIVTIPAGMTGTFEDTCNSDTLVSGDLVNSLVTVGKGGTVSISLISFILKSTNNTPILCAWYPSSSQGYGKTRYYNISGKLKGDTHEVYSQYTFRTEATWSNLRVYCLKNTLDGATTVRVRISGTNGNQVITIPAGMTGAFEDAINTDYIAAGDNVSYQVITGGTTGSIIFCLMQVKSESTVRQIAAGNLDAHAFGFGQTRYLTIEGDCESTTASDNETRAQLKARQAFTGQNMFVSVQVNTLDGNTTIKLRKNGADGYESITIPAKTKGVFEDTINTDSIAASDLIDWQIITEGSSGKIEIDYIGFELAQPRCESSISNIPPSSKGFDTVKDNSGYWSAFYSL
jgi:hypothetical protein